MDPTTRKTYATMLAALMLELSGVGAHANAFGFVPGMEIALGLLILAVAIVAESILYRVWFPISWAAEEHGPPSALGVSALANLTSAIAALGAWSVLGLVAWNLVHQAAQSYMEGSPLALAGLFLGSFGSELASRAPGRLV